MPRPLQNILRKQQPKMRITGGMQKLLVELAKGDDPHQAHKNMALLIQVWLRSSSVNKD